MDRFSSLHRLVHTTALLRRWMKAQRENRGRVISPVEYQQALCFHIREEQELYFGAELKLLREKRNAEVKNPIAQFAPFIDAEGLLKVGGRVTNSDLLYGQKHPVILSKDRLAELLIANAVPRNRVIVCPPFTNSACDYAGPFRVRHGNARNTFTKCYAAVFVCLSTKAVHIELAEDLSSRSFLEVFDRFISRGLCRTLVSDNGTQFVGAVKIIKDHLAKWTTPDVKQHPADYGVDWKFITPAAPHHGGLWEAAVKSAKKHLLRVVGNQSMRFGQMMMLLTRIEACLNSRPIMATNWHGANPRRLFDWPPTTFSYSSSD